MQVVQLFSCLDKISYIEWALDSEYILCGLYKRPMIQAWSLSQPEWTCKIDEGPAGIAYARWSPDSRHILTTSDFQLRLTVWSLLSTACVHLQWPKHASKGVSFTRDGKFAAICTRRDCKDYINLLSCHTWEIMGTFAVDTVDLADIEWSPDDSAIVIWDSPLEYKVLIYSPDGRCLFKYQAYESGLGVKSVSWSPCGQFLAVGSYDQMVRVLNHLTWKTFAEFMHPNTVRGPCYAAVFKEVDEPLQLDMSELCLSDDFPQGNDDAPEEPFRVRYEVTEVPINLPFQKPPADKPNPKQGIVISKPIAKEPSLFNCQIVIQKDSPRGVHFRRAGPREKVYFKPEEVRACIVTCGGLCPGINTVIREIVCGLNYMYGVEDILGIEGGYRGFYSKNTMKLTPKVVNDIHKRGGTFLRTSRGGHDTHKIVDNIEDRGINQVYIIGGDGTQKGAQLIYEEIAKRGLPVAVAGIPKTIDNDIAVIDKSFGFDTAVEEAQRAINAAHVEVESVENGVGIVKLMGRYSESPFYLEGEGGLFEFIEQRLKENGHLVIVVAEGAGQEYVAADVHAAGKKDASGNKLLLDNGIWLSDKIKDHFTKVQKMVINMKYIDPTYMIRAIPSNASDNIYCTLLAHSAVHGAMAGYTGFTVGPVNSRHAYIPIARVTERTNTVKLTDRMWGRLLASTNQPSFISSDKEIIQDLSNINITST
ncbi:hypothetical protein TanjilG_01703 [Lupinus angustifolius]|nr:hypothetical protein TanjilG_01703 [Lupinus angustifolius]